MVMDRKAFAQDWEQGWNSHDLDVILRHYRDDIVFRSKKAVALVGRGEILERLRFPHIGPRYLSASLI